MPDNTTLRTNWRVPHPARFSPTEASYDACMGAHAEASQHGHQGYLDPYTGLFVMTATYLSQRPCCENNCRHCPWIADR